MVTEWFVVRIPSAFELNVAVSLVCASRSTISWYTEGSVSANGFVGFNGFGHVGVKTAAAIGAEVTVLLCITDKAEDLRANATLCSIQVSVDIPLGDYFGLVRALILGAIINVGLANVDLGSVAVIGDDRQLGVYQFEYR